MVTKADLVEAQSFDRRRLVTALVSGAGGAGPGRSARTLVGGLALAVLVVAGAVIANLVAPRPPADWTSHGLILSEQTGQAYVIVGDGSPSAEPGSVVLRPVANLTSARLVLGPGAEPVSVPQDLIETQPIGADIGILGAPASLPPPDRLVESGWTACTADRRGTRVSVAADPDVEPARDAGQVIAVGAAFYLVASVPVGERPAAAYAVRLPDGDGVDNLLGAIGLPARALAPSVPRAWLDLFPRGATLDARSLGITGVGRRPPDWDGAGVPPRVRVGDVLVDATGDAVVMTLDGPADLDPFAAAVYTHPAAPGGGTPRVRSVGRIPDLTRTTLPVPETHWPTELPEPLTTDPCAVLVTAPDAPAVVELAQLTATGDGAADVAPGHAEVTVDPGHGAFVLAAGPREPGADPVPVVVDGAGRADPLEGDAAGQLGYADVRAPVVPTAWVRLLGPGVVLSRELALRGG